MSRRMSAKQERYFNDLAAADRARRGPGFFGGFVGAVARRSARPLLVLVVLMVVLAVFSAFVPGLIGLMLGVAILWPVYLLGVFTLTAARTGDRVPARVYWARLRTVIDTNVNAWGRNKVGIGALVTLVGVTLAALAGGTDILTSLDRGVGSMLALAVAAAGVLEMLTRKHRVDAAGAQTPTAADPGPRATHAHAPGIIATPPAPLQIDAPGPRAAANRKRAS
jgi:hypothetical protein